jgi:hypothetical protein
MLVAGVSVTAGMSLADARDRNTSGSVTAELARPAAGQLGATPQTGAAAGTAAQQTDPRVHPHRGTRRSRFSVRFTLRDAPGHQGVVAGEYTIRVDRPHGSRTACTAPRPETITSGARGSRISMALPRPRYGWCRGRYAVTVHWGRGPYCPPAQNGEPPPPCPLFASQDLEVGETSFSVTA